MKTQNLLTLVFLGNLSLPIRHTGHKPTAFPNIEPLATKSVTSEIQLYKD